VPVVIAPREHLRYEWLPWREAADRVFSWTNADALRMLPVVTPDLARAAALLLPR
jgi:dATP pyrophosphohydrolase